MKASTALLWAACAATLAAALPQGIDQDLECVKDGDGVPFLRWWGVSGRSCFIQYCDPADPLHIWVYSTNSETGADEPISYELTGQEELPPPGFFRLRYLDRVPGPDEDLNMADFDDDGLSNQTELESTLTDPLESDTDKDGMPDGWEIDNELDPNDPADAQGDLDSDGLTNLDEYLKLTDPDDPDTDADGLTDGDEVFVHHTSPTSADSDGDYLSDYDELFLYGTAPTKWDTDGDSLSDREEVLETLTNPLADDTDGDWMDDGFECSALLAYGTALDPWDPADGALDHDGDTLLTRLEYLFLAEGFDPFTANDPATFPWTTDPDSDGETTAAEWNATGRTNPKCFDTDGDGLPDGWERLHNLDPTSSQGEHGSTGDPDGDGLTNFDEWLNGTHPRNADTDGDGTQDGAEIAAHTDPLKDEPPPPADSQNNLPVPQFEDIPFAVGDPSGSESERWKMTITGHGPDDFRVLSLASPGFGQIATRTLKLRKWNRYRIILTHLETSPAHRRTSGPDYDWLATVDGLPSAGLPPFEQSPRYFMLRNHWLVDNFWQLLSPSSEGATQDPTAGCWAMVQPVDIDDNQPASGTDDISCTAPSTEGGYQPEHWIMAPAGPVPEDPSWGNTMVWNTPLPSNPTLSMFTLAATRNPPEVSLDNSRPSVVWRGATAATTEDTPAWSLDPPNHPAYTPVDLPITVKVMKKRNLTIAVFPVRSLEEDRPVPVPSATALAAEFNRVFGWQVNLWLKEEDIIIHDHSHRRYEDHEDFEGDEVDGSGRTLDTRSDAFGTILATHRDSGADFNLILIDRVTFKDAHGTMVGFRPPPTNSAFVTTADAENNNRPEESVCATATHEFGHVMISPFHPDQGGGPAPLPHTDRTERLMHSQFIPFNRRLVKAEWDKAEEWMVSNKDSKTP